MEMLRNICNQNLEDLTASIKASQEREQEMMARQNKVVPEKHGNRRQRRAYQAELRKKSRLPA
jgi:hypothetical protein